VTGHRGKGRYSTFLEEMGECPLNIAPEERKRKTTDLIRGGNFPLKRGKKEKTEDDATIAKQKGGRGVNAPSRKGNT